MKKILNNSLFAWLWVSGGNLLIFLAVVRLFGERIHHHWMVPLFSALIMLESALIYFVFGERRTLWLKAVTPWILLVALILQWRQRSMFQCFRHCEGRLSLGLFCLAAAGFLVAAGLDNPVQKRAAACLYRGILLWLVIILAMGTMRGTFTWVFVPRGIWG
ncbi:MAG: hypothetical protein A2270_00005 [Elusimicrobia bacterium RIFOXYA12_FULL_51_18]|nr:MAG: hypothetical protein A2270_00005 [Elusimicrobia bacterium RIFOXYA12_FULL_51_18]OGS32356.1 MAG: hypothetical protein A2218_03095 [Elusimicrobia bacterium RIFOXYA2_FULL_53_38]